MHCSASSLHTQNFLCKTLLLIWCSCPPTPLCNTPLKFEKQHSHLHLTFSRFSRPIFSPPAAFEISVPLLCRVCLFVPTLPSLPWRAILASVVSSCVKSFLSIWHGPCTQAMSSPLFVKSSGLAWADMIAARSKKTCHGMLIVVSLICARPIRTMMPKPKPQPSCGCQLHLKLSPSCVFLKKQQH